MWVAEGLREDAYVQLVEELLVGFVVGGICRGRHSEFRKEQEIIRLKEVGRA